MYDFTEFYDAIQILGWNAKRTHTWWMRFVTPVRHAGRWGILQDQAQKHCQNLDSYKDLSKNGRNH